MLRNGLARELRDVALLSAKLLTGAYPGFVYGGRLTGIPVFTGHTIRPEAFEAQLRFLARNGYRTLTADEYHAAVTGQRPAPERSVLLTFDDGWSSLWSVGLPLLRRYGAKIVVLLAAGRIQQGGLGPTMDDGEASTQHTAHSTQSVEELLRRESGPSALLTWDEVRALHESGLVDVQSHSVSHSLVFSSPRIEEFARLSLLAKLSMMQMPEWAGADATVRPGRPIYAAAPRMGERRRFIEDPAVREACERHAAERGGEAFFRRPGWRAELLGVAQRAGASSGRGRYETDEERAAAIWHELAESKRIIEAYLPGKTVRHFAFPWDRSCALALELAAKAGYAMTFVEQVRGRQMAVRPGTPAQAARLGIDWLMTLPGEGRWSLAQPLAAKFGRQLRAGRKQDSQNSKFEVRSSKSVPDGAAEPVR